MHQTRSLVDSIKRDAVSPGHQAALRQVNCYHLCVAVTSKCPKTQFLFANPGQYCFLTYFQGDSEAGVGRPLGEHQPAGLRWWWLTRPRVSPEQRWEQLFVCLAPPTSIHLQIWELPHNEVKVHSITDNRYQGNRRQPKLNYRLHCQKQNFEPQSGWAPVMAYAP